MNSGAFHGEPCADVRVQILWWFWPRKGVFLSSLNRKEHYGWLDICKGGSRVRGLRPRVGFQISEHYTDRNPLNLPQSFETLTSSAGTPAGVQFDSHPGPVRMIDAAVRVRLLHTLQVPLGGLQSRKTRKETTATPIPGACCHWTWSTKKTASQGRRTLGMSGWEGKTA